MVKVKAYAKVNFFLKVVGTDGEGYHLLDTVMASVSLFDEISVLKRADGSINLICPAVRGENTALAAARLFQESFGTCGFDISIKKGIPIAAGLGGSSADIAGMLYALGRLYGKDMESLREIAARCGSDAPFMLKGGFARATGRGDAIEPFECGKAYHLVIAKPEGGVPSGEAYRFYDEMKKEGLIEENPGDGKEAARCLREGDINGLAKLCLNDLTLPAKRLLPDIAEVERRLLAFSPACLFMSGSGSAMVALFESAQKSRLCARQLKNQGLFACSVTTKNYGVEEM
ncbi:MAG: 4-(cytidine 5'-diphospho)-2-C-methyl-D-erythritol kinase [Clostridiales bacterium]|jgi:4-diphosphocytidyl-2-C-methyl-D-erythritol kinase|nr:4-(cytidine 5'-diphospho)-2-C-methyl-D-erythritol kinase [Clostridiales bacterium]